MITRDKIGIFVRRPRDFYIFETLAQDIDAEFITVPTLVMAPFSQDTRKLALSDNRRAVESLLTSRNAAWRKAPENILGSGTEEIEHFFSPYAALLDTQKSFFLMHPALHAKKKILYFHDNAIPGYWPTTSFSNIDLVLATGSYFHRMLQPFVETALVGDLYLDLPEQFRPHELPFKLSENKKTILFMPTENLFHSPAGFAGAINSGAEEHNVIVQLSQETRLAKRNLNLFSLNKKITVVDEAFDVRRLRSFVDLALSDCATTVLEWLAMGKPSVILDAWTYEFLIQRGYVPPQKQVKADGGLYAAFDAVELSGAIRDALQSETPVSTGFAREFFDRGNRSAAERAAEVIKRSMAEERAVPSSRSVLVFHPGDYALQNFVLQQRMRDWFSAAVDIIREPIAFKKILKIIKTFF